MGRYLRYKIKSKGVVAEICFRDIMQELLFMINGSFKEIIKEIEGEKL